MDGGRRLGTGIFALATLVLCAPAEATTFCVPGFSGACPNSGGNVAQANIETAMQTNAGDGVADVILIDNLTVTNPGPVEAIGSDPLTIQGTGPASEITTTSVTNEFVLNLNTGNTRAVTVRDLGIVVPASMPPDAGGAAIVSGDTLENVDLISRNPGPNGSIGLDGWVGGGTFRGGEVRGEGGGTISSGITSSSFSTGTLVVEQARVDGALSGVQITNPTATMIMRRSEVLDPGPEGITVAAGAATVENTVVATDSGFALNAQVNSANSATLDADHITIVNTGDPNQAGFRSRVASSQAGDANATLTNSVMRGYDLGYIRSVGMSATGGANLTIRHSNVPATGSSTGAGTLDVAVGNITADPLFTSATDFHLLTGSPSIDAGDPAAGGLAVDLDGAPRPVDGNADGVARRDQGAYEFQPPVPPPPPTPDTTPPETTISAGPGKRVDHGKARFRFDSSEAGSSFECKLDKKKFKSCSPPKSYKRLDAGKHRFRVRATDAAGNVDATPAKCKWRRKVR
jgi:hypothetical protein